MHPIKLNRHSNMMRSSIPKSVDKETRLANEHKRKVESDKNGTLKKYVKTIISPIED